MCPLDAPLERARSAWSRETS